MEKDKALEVTTYISWPTRKDENSMADQPADESNTWTPENSPYTYSRSLVFLLENGNHGTKQ